MKYNRFFIAKRFNKHVKIPVGFVIILQIIAIASMVTSLATPYLYSLLVDEVMTNGNIRLLYFIFPAMIAVFIVGIGLSGLSTYILLRYNNTVNLRVKKKLFEKFMGKEIADVQNIDVGWQQNIIEKDSGAVASLFIGHIGGFFTSFLYLAIYFTLMLLISPWLTLVSVVFIPIAILFGRFIGKKFNKYQNELWKIDSANRTFLFETIQKWREVKAQNLEQKLVKEYDEKLQPERRTLLAWMFYLAMNNVFYAFKSRFVQTLLLYFVGGILIILGQVTIGSLLMFMSYMGSFSENVDSIINSITGFVGSKAQYDRLFDIFETEVREKVPISKDKFDIRLHGVNFSYGQNLPNILSDISYNFKFGKKYLIVGKSGGGKSTLIKLILGMIYPDSGKIQLDDTDIRNINQQSYFTRLTAVMQENHFFNLSIRENLLMISPDATAEEIEYACKNARISEFIHTLPEGYDTIIGERGIKLSGGQKQRLAIARLILHNPQIAILDEATSSLDAVSETEILTNLNHLFSGKTLIIISHKPAMQIDFNERIVVENNDLIANTI